MAPTFSDILPWAFSYAVKLVRTNGPMAVDVSQIFLDHGEYPGVSKPVAPYCPHAPQTDLGARRRAR